MSNESWNNYLISIGAQFSTENPAFITAFSGSEPANQTPEDTLLCPLTHLGLLGATGPDSNKFLQGQLTCDLNKITPEQSALGAACTPAGRIYSSFRLIERADQENSQYLLRMRQDIIPDTLETLAKYIVFFKSEIADLNQEWIGIGVVGRNCDEPLAELFGSVPQAENQVIQNQHGLVIRVPGELPRYECWITANQAQSCWELLAQKALPAPTSRWILQDIEAGIAEVCQINREAFIPQMLNFQAIDAISFDKGCYTGQEIVARTQYRGKAKRLMVRAVVKNGPALTTGMELTRPGESKHVATLVQAAPLDDQQQELLMVVSSDLISQEQWDLCFQETCFKASLLPLPYHCADSIE